MEHMESNMVNRSKGWKRAKLSGHLNEELVASFLKEGVVNVSVCGKTKVQSILGRKTPTKPDIRIDFGHTVTNRSLKKSLSGQVHLNSVDTFIRGYEVKYSKVPASIQETLKMVFGGSKITHELLQRPELIHENLTIRNMELRRKTLCFETLRKYDEVAMNDLVVWFQNNIDRIATIVFKTGWVQDSQNFANELWYKNLVDEGSYVDQVFNIDNIITKSLDRKSEVYPKTKNGGTVISLPFGWVQYHQGQMQFHHSYTQISKLLVD
jgi:hypothetical protein